MLHIEATLLVGIGIIISIRVGINVIIEEGEVNVACTDQVTIRGLSVGIRKPWLCNVQQLSVIAEGHDTVPMGACMHSNKLRGEHDPREKHPSGRACAFHGPTRVVHSDKPLGAHR